jgi:hypothetical protein
MNYTVTSIPIFLLNMYFEIFVYLRKHNTLLHVVVGNTIIKIKHHSFLHHQARTLGRTIANLYFRNTNQTQF